MIKREMRFTTFLKLLELTHKKQRTTLRSFTKPGGYNFWSPTQQLGPQLVSHTLLSADVEKRVTARCKGTQAKHNVRALTKLASFLESRNPVPIVGVGSVSAPFGDSGLTIRLEPEAMFSEDGIPIFAHVWATLEPLLSSRTLSMGLLFFRAHFKVSAPDISVFFILDVVKDRLFGDKDIVSNGEALLAADQKRLSDLWHELTNPPGSPPPEDQPDDADRPRPPG